MKLLLFPVVFFVLFCQGLSSPNGDQGGCGEEGEDCLAAADCCSGQCLLSEAGGVCGLASATLPELGQCLEDGEFCMSPLECCSLYCSHSFYCGTIPQQQQQEESPINQCGLLGTFCLSSDDCCSGYCGAGFECGFLLEADHEPDLGGGGQCLEDGEYCWGEEECCSGLCSHHWPPTTTPLFGECGPVPECQVILGKYSNGHQKYLTGHKAACRLRTCGARRAGVTPPAARGSPVSAWTWRTVC